MFDAEPEGWREVRLGEVASINPEGLGQRTDPGLRFGYIDISRIERPGFCDGWTATTFGEAPSRARRMVRENDILVSTVRPYLRAFAKVPPSEQTLIASTGFAVVRANDQADQDFLFQHIMGDGFVEHLKPRMTGSNYPAVASGDVAEYVLALPPLDEQRRIAEVLCSIDEALSSARAVAEAARRSVRNMRHELLHVSAEGQIDGPPDGWDVRPLEALASVERGKFSVRPRNDPRYFGGTVPFIQTGDITAAGDYLVRHSQTLNELGVGVSRVFPAGTIMTTIAANIGDFTITTYPVACPDSVVGIEAREGVHPFWLYSVLSCFKIALDRAATQNAQKNINLQTLRPLLIPVPPLGLMAQLAETLEAAAEAALDADMACTGIEAVKRGVARDLLSGRIRVSV